MIICHDLKLVFLHVPKCAGTALRRVFKQQTIVGSSVAFFDFSYSQILRRHVDLAHLPLMDLRHYPEWRYLKHYHTVACIRHPYARLASACREFYRQCSRDTELQMRREPPTTEQLQAYLDALPAALEAHDLRYVHGFPIVWFTHYGTKPMVDSLLRCEHLYDDILSFSARFPLPENLRTALLDTARPDPEAGQRHNRSSLQTLIDDPNLIAMCNLLHREDFSTFRYPRIAARLNTGDLAKRMELCLHSTASHAIPHTSLAPRMRWYWGRNSNITWPPMAPSRQRRRRRQQTSAVG